MIALELARGTDSPRLREGARCPDCEPVPHPFDSQSVRQWLRAMSQRLDPSEFRIAFGQAGVAIHRCSSNDVLDQVARMLASGRLHICRPSKQQEIQNAGGTATDVHTPAEPQPFPRSESRPRPEPSPPPDDPPTFPASIDPDAVQAVMQEAARLGVPFCEECMKARASG